MLNIGFWVNFFFFPHFVYAIPLPIRLTLFLMRSQPVAYSQSYSCSLVSDESFSCCFQDFSLYLPTVWLWSMFIIPGVPQASWICRLIFSIKFRKYLAIFYYFLLLSLTSLLQYMNILTYILHVVPQIWEALFIVLQSFFHFSY